MTENPFGMCNNHNKKAVVIEEKNNKILKRCSKCLGARLKMNRNGWFHESARHSLARKGIKTGRKKRKTTFHKSQTNLTEYLYSPEVTARINKAYKQEQKDFRPLKTPKKYMVLDKASKKQQEIFNEGWQLFRKKYPDDAKRILSVQLVKEVPTGALVLNLGKIVLHESDLTDAEGISKTLLHEVFHIRSVEAGKSMEDTTSFNLEFKAALYSGKKFDEILRA